MAKIFRTQPATLSEEEIKAMLKKNDFFDYNMNKEGCGFVNQFEVQIREGDKVIFDRASGLIWQQQGSSKRMTFRRARQWIEELNSNGYAGFYDWRLPTLEEAMSLIEREKNNNALYINPVFNGMQTWIWTCDLMKGSSWAWVVSFEDGFCFYYKFCYNYWSQAVCSVQSSDF